MTSIYNFSSFNITNGQNYATVNSAMTTCKSNSGSIFNMNVPMESPIKMQLKQKQEEIKKLENRLKNAPESSKKSLENKIASLKREIKQLKSFAEQDSSIERFNQFCSDSFERMNTETLPEDRLASRLNKKISEFKGGGDYNKEAGADIAQTAEQEANKMSSIGKCYRGVKNTLKQYGVDLNGGSAYQAASQLSNNINFKEVKALREELSSLPQGAVVVWDKSQGHEHGHISIALGNGREASDHVQNQMTGRNASYRVFLPVGNMEKYA